MGGEVMDFGSVVTIISIIVTLLGIAYGVSKYNIKNSGIIKDIKDSTVTMSNINIGENNNINKGDKDEHK